ncbi:SurA N-terminal domain-containing protein [Pontibacterium granulatum]|uniref:SurA N-terminal domain-containing protein n=1 Tax=Pontibacterium granulatum TaxID=2036029 RepID=UPI00249A7306|nr:SurA N-terminal domain-containing protein [Pontibacterium granulatum]MDI3326018.1 SurA N-terminal domain-containing protein [Pontibacterium granulatum]
MLQTIRNNSQSIIAKVIVGLIVVTFALFGVESLVSLTSGSNAPATVNGEEISERQLLQGVELQRRQLLNQMGENADPTLLDDNVISKMVLDGLIEQAVLTQAADSQGLIFSDRMIDQLLVNTPSFQIDGAFDRAQFEAVLRNAGLTPMMYRDLVRKEKLVEQMRTGYLLSAFALDSELDSVVALDQQKRDLSYFTLNADKVAAEIEISDDEARGFYDANRGNYKTEEQVVIEYLLLDKVKMLDEVEVSDDEVQQQYQALAENFEGQEERKASHILIEISDERSADDAEAKAAAIAQRIAAGEDFAELAKTESDDLGSAESGGDLGYNAKGLFVPEFEDALFAMEKGQVSEPVLTDFGYHIIKLVDIQTTEPPSFEEAQNDIKYDLLREKAEGVYVERLERLADLSFSSGDLVEPSETLGMEIITSEPFSRLGGDDDVTGNNRVVAAAFTEELLKEGVNSTPIELDASRSVVVRVKEHKLPREQSYDEVAEEVKSQLLNDRIAKALDEKVEDILAALNAGETLASLADGAEVSSLEAVGRGQRDLPPEVLQQAFKVPHPADGDVSYASTTLGDGGRAIIAISGVEQGGVESLSDDERKAMQSVLGSRKGQYDYQDLVVELNASAEIERL